MKNILKYLTLVLFIAGMSSCAKEEIGGVAVQNMCGEWYVTVDEVDEDGNVIEEDPYEMGYVTLYTYNTNANLATEMYLEDYYYIYGGYGFRLIVNVDYANMTFSCNDAEDDYWGFVFSVKDGKIGINDTTSFAGYTADSISFILEDTYEEDGETVTDRYWYHGYRRTGLNGGYD